jgi:hypothetical protein
VIRLRLCAYTSAFPPSLLGELPPKSLTTLGSGWPPSGAGFTSVGFSANDPALGDKVPPRPGNSARPYSNAWPRHQHHRHHREAFASAAFPAAGLPALAASRDDVCVFAFLAAADLAAVGFPFEVA